MLTIQTPKPWSVDLGTSLTANPIIDINHAGRLHTDLLGSLLTGLEFPILGVNVDSLINVSSEGTASTGKLFGLSRPADINVHTRVPLLSYQRQAQDLWALLRGKWQDFGGGSVSASAGENPTQHTNIFGRVENGHHIGARYSKSQSFEFGSSGVSVSSVPNELLYTPGKRVLSPDPTGYLELSDPIQYFLDDVSLDNIKSHVESGVFDSTSGNVQDVFSHFTFRFLKDGIDLAYVWTLGSFDWPSMKWDVYYVYNRLRFITFTYNAAVEEPFLASDICDANLQRIIRDPIQNQVFSNWEDARSLALTNFPFSISWVDNHGTSIINSVNIDDSESMPVFVPASITEGKIFDFVGFSPLSNSYYSGGKKSLQTFSTVMENKFPRCVAGNAVSSIDAVNSHFGQLSKADHIEAIVELREILAPLNLFKAAVALVHRGGGGLKGLVDLLADAKLTYSFAISPTFNDAVEVSRNLRKFIRKLNDSRLFGTHTIYGKKTYRVQDDSFLPFRDVRVVCRSKIRVGTNADTILPYILPARGLGLLPSFSSAWNLIPLSFVADWLTRTGSSLSLLEDQAVLLMLNLEYSVHSISIIYDFDGEDMEDNGFHVEGASEDPAGYKYYVRYVLPRTIPFAGPTVLPLIGNIGIPDYGTAGALLYKFL